MIDNGMNESITYTDKNNIKLQNLYISNGYIMSEMPDDFVKLSKCLQSNKNGIP